MATPASPPGAGKLSPQFEARLGRLAPGEKVRAVVFLGAGAPSPGCVGRQTAEEHEEAAKQVQRAAEAALAAVDQILDRNQGRRLAEESTALGSVAVEVDAAGIRELAQEPSVTAIFEDQPPRLPH